MGLLRAALKMKSVFLLGEAAGAGGVAAHAVVLAEGAMKAMVLTKIKIAVVALVSVGLLGVGAGVATHHALADKPTAGRSAPGAKNEPPPANREPPDAGSREPKAARTDRYGDPLPEGALARLGTTRFRHGWFVQSVTFSPNGKVLASTGCGRAVCLWDVATGRELHHFPMHDQPRSVVFSPDGKSVVSGWNPIRMWDVASGKELRQFGGPGNQSCMSLAFSPDGSVLASGAHDKLIHLWDVATGKPLQQLEGHEKTVFALAFSPDGRLLASGGDETVRLWDPATGKEVGKLPGHKPGVLSLSFSPDGKLLAAVGFEEPASG
jgi:hypothetical protein